ncbi:MAG: amino acid permease [Bdellovibrionales bacterium]|nr:amino acid permease [Bdellovibrionales bacterium]
MQSKLKRTLGLFQVSFYGIGTILGAGIYALIGKISAVAGIWVPMSFVFSAVLVSFTAYSYIQLVRMFPKSAGEAEYVYQSFKSLSLSNLVGWLVAFSGLVSAATLTRGFVGYFQTFFDINTLYIQLGLIVFIALIAVAGIRESAWTAVVITFIEVFGLLLICWKGFPFVLNEGLTKFKAEAFFDIGTIAPVLSGGFLAIYAYIGFEDIVNLAEEVKKPKRNIPLAIFFSLLVSTVLYVLVGLVSVSALSPQELGASDSPLSEVYKKSGGNPAFLSLIGLFAIFNGLLAQVIMVSRILYGTRHQLKFLKLLSVVNLKTQTPIISTVFISVSILLFSLNFPIEKLAGGTSYLILSIFTLINAALITINFNASTPKLLNYFMPSLGILLNVGLIIINFLNMNF